MALNRMQEGTGQPDWLGTICEFFTNRRKLPQFVNELCSGHVHPESLWFFQLQQHGNNFALGPAQTFPPTWQWWKIKRNQKGPTSEIVVFDIMYLWKEMMERSKDLEHQERESVWDVPGSLSKIMKQIELSSLLSTLVTYPEPGYLFRVCQRQ